MIFVIADSSFSNWLFSFIWEHTLQTPRLHMCKDASGRFSTLYPYIFMFAYPIHYFLASHPTPV
jgi:hypothetical protein